MCAKNAPMALASHREGSSNASHADKASTKIRLASLPASAALWASMRSEFRTDARSQLFLQEGEGARECTKPLGDPVLCFKRVRPFEEGTSM